MNEIVKVENNVLTMSENAQTLMKKLDEKIAELTKERDEIKTALLTAMLDNGIYKYESEILSVTAKQPMRNNFSAVQFKEKYPELWEEMKYETVNETMVKENYGKAYKECSVETPIKPSLAVKYKG